MSDQDDEYVIRNLAYELWEAAGRPPGKHLDFWEQAKRRVQRDATSPGDRQDAAPSTHNADAGGGSIQGRA